MKFNQEYRIYILTDYNENAHNFIGNQNKLWTY